MTLDLSRSRELGALFGDSLRLYFRNFGRFLAIGVAVVVPAQLIVSGVGLHELSGGYDLDRSVGAEAVPVVLQALVTTPLVVAMTVYLVLDVAAGRKPSLRRAIQSGLDSFGSLFPPVLAVAVGLGLLLLLTLLPVVALGSAVLLPLLAVPIIVGVRWYFVPQTVVAGGARRLDALRASWELTRGFGWRVFGTGLLAYLAFGLITTVAVSPIAAAAKSADSSALLLLSQVVHDAVAAPALALVSVLLYFDIKARRAQAAA